MSNVVTRALSGIWARATGGEPRGTRAGDEHFGGMGNLPGSNGSSGLGMDPGFQRQQRVQPTDEHRH